jgi:3-keto-5-aminohexanoate cleavage enzyme
MDRRELLQKMAAAGALAATVPVTRVASAATAKSVTDTPVILEVAINGSTTKAVNPLAPETIPEVTAEIIRCFDAGATIVHTHSNQPNKNLKKAAQPYLDAFLPVWKKHPHAILYATANFDPKVYNKNRRAWVGKVQCGHHRILAEAGAANMVLLDTGVVPLAGYDERGIPTPESSFFWYGFWPDDTKEIMRTCDDFGTGTSVSVFEPGWMKNVVAMARAGALPRGSKLNIYFAPDSFAAMAPPIPEALELYLKMMEGLDLKWSVGAIGATSIMDTPLARMALERGGSFRVGLEDWGAGPGNLEQLARAKEIINAVGRPIVSGADAIRYLDIPYARTWPGA